MTTLNTIIEEEKDEVTKQLDITLPPCDEVITGGHFLDVQKAIHTLITSAMQRAYEAGQSEERARIRETFDDWFKNGTEDVEDWADRNLPTNQGQISR